MNTLMNEEGNIEGSRMCTLSNEQLAYVAGFLDGDGCIASNYERSKPDSSYRVRIRISFTQKSSRRIVLDTLRSWINSGVVAQYEHNDMAEYVIRDQKVVEQLLIAISPFLIVKKQHAEIAMQIIFLKKEPYTADSLEKMKNHTIAIRALNHYPKRTILTP